MKLKIDDLFLKAKDDLDQIVKLEEEHENHKTPGVLSFMFHHSEFSRCRREIDSLSVEVSKISVENYDKIKSIDLKLLSDTKIAYKQALEEYQDAMKKRGILPTSSKEDGVDQFNKHITKLEEYIESSTTTFEDLYSSLLSDFISEINAIFSKLDSKENAIYFTNISKDIENLKLLTSQGKYKDLSDFLDQMCKKIPDDIEKNKAEPHYVPYLKFKNIIKETYNKHKSTIANLSLQILFVKFLMNNLVENEKFRQAVAPGGDIVVQYKFKRDIDIKYNAYKENFANDFNKFAEYYLSQESSERPNIIEATKNHIKTLVGESKLFNKHILDRFNRLFNNLEKATNLMDNEDKSSSKFAAKISLFFSALNGVACALLIFNLLGSKNLPRSLKTSVFMTIGTIASGALALILKNYSSAQFKNANSKYVSESARKNVLNSVNPELQLY